MADIPIQIPQRNFEIIRDGIGALLAFELADQAVTANVGVWRERMIAFDQKELPAVNVGFDNNNFDNQNAISKIGTMQFFIDVMANEKHVGHEKEEQGDLLANITCQRIAGIIDYILSSTEYYTLGFAPGLIRSRWVSSINMGKLSEQDTKHSTVCRLTFNVIANEEVNPVAATPLSILGTQVKLNETDEGYKFEIIKT
jgi:hypothetical protein